MAGVLGRLFKVGQAEAHAAIDKIEDPIKRTEQGIRDLKDNLAPAMKSLAEVKALAIRLKQQADNDMKAANDFEKKAMALLQKAQAGEIPANEAESLATEALAHKEECAKRSAQEMADYQTQDKMASSLQAKVNDMKKTISQYENELVTLTARAKTADSMTKINKQLTTFDSSSTVAMIEKMKQKVNEKESLASAYTDIADQDTVTNLDTRIDKALASGSSAPGSDALAELKKKMGMQ